MTERMRGLPIGRWLTSTSLIDSILLAACAAALIGSVVVLYATVSQPLLEAHGFRQTQTALTAYWFIHDGFSFAYQTPISGYPWRIPLEFPFYQGVVALTATLTHLPLDSAGRAVSYLFFVATIVPVAVICRTLNLGHRVFLIFATLYLTSPHYLFWGRTFLMESAATFLSVATIAAALPFLLGRRVSLSRALLVVVLASLAITQKITTGLPVVMVLVACMAAAFAMHWLRGDRHTVTVIGFGIILLTMPVLLGIGWTYYTDALKSQSEFAKLWTSSELRAWNFGTLGQRVSSDLLRNVIWTRSLKVNAGSYVGLAVLGLFYIKETRKSQVSLAAVAIALFMLPLLLFTNLHIIHEYYQTSTTIYIVFLLALALAYLAGHSLLRVFLLAFALIVLSNLANFKQFYWPLARESITAEKNRTLAIASLLREQTSPSARVLVYGYSMSSEIAYYSERKSVTVPDEDPLFEAPLKDPARFFGRDKVGALVICPMEDGRTPSEAEVQRFLEANGPFRELAVDKCRVFIGTEPARAGAAAHRAGS